MKYISEYAGYREDGGLRWGVESICTVLTEHGIKIALSTYYEWVGKTPTCREERDEVLKAQISRVHAANYGVYGARKVWLVLNREGIPVARCNVERLMGELGFRGAVRGKIKRTTMSDPKAVRAADLVRRDFTPPGPGYVVGGRFYVCFDLVRVGLRCVRDRCLRPANPWLVREYFDEHPVRSRCLESSDLDQRTH